MEKDDKRRQVDQVEWGTFKGEQEEKEKLNWTCFWQIVEGHDGKKTIEKGAAYERKKKDKNDPRPEGGGKENISRRGEKPLGTCNPQMTFGDDDEPDFALNF